MDARRLPAAATAAALAALLAACAPQATAPPATSGVARAHIDPAVRPQDDLFRHANGRWLAETQIPADRPSVGAGADLREQVQLQLRSLVEDIERSRPQGEPRKIADLYASFMDEATIERRGLAPLGAELAAIEQVRDARELGALFARLARRGANGPIALFIGQDGRDASRTLPYLNQSGLGLPDRDYYVVESDARFADIRAKYLAHMARLLALADGRPVDSGHEAAAREVLALETRIARAQWTRVENRDRIKTYNKLAVSALPPLAPALDWRVFLAGLDLAGRSEELVVRQPGYLNGLNALLTEVPVAHWRSYARVHVLAAAAPYLSQDFVDERFAFAGGVLRGTPENTPRWKRGVALVDDAVGEALGRLYVARHFPPGHQAKMDGLVANLMQAYKTSIDGLDWMGPATKREAQAKLAKFRPKVGHPRQWRDYAGLDIQPGDLFGNVERAHAFEYARQLAKLGKPVDREEWFMTPQTVNAYYSPTMNEIVFPAAILQPPFFDVRADDAVNYGAVGAIIGHEISHGFDDQGSRSDGDGNLRDWWTPEDRARFAAKTKVLVEQYGAFEPVAGYKVNGELTLGENIADNSGLEIAWKAYKLSLGGRPAPVIDGLTGEQRFFYGFAQAWRGKMRDAAMIERVKSDPHSPPEFRANGTVRNHPGYYETFEVKPGDGMYLPPDQRVSIW